MLAHKKAFYLEESTTMHSLKRNFTYKLVVLGLSFGISLSVIASELPPFEGWFVDPYNPTKAIFVSQADPNTNAMADLLEARTILANEELANAQADIDRGLAENQKTLSVD